MATLFATGIADLLAVTLRDLGRMRFQQIAQDLQDYEVFTKWFRRDKVAFDEGIGIQRTLMAKFESSQAAFVGLEQEDSVNIPDVLTTMTVDWRHAMTAWALEYRETLMNRGRAVVEKIIKPRRANALLALVSKLESGGWGSPASTSAKEPNGIRYWVVYNATDGFTGAAPTGHTLVGNVNLTTYPNFKNYSATYTTANRTDLIKKMRTAHRKIRFKSPISIQDYRRGRGDRYRIYTTETILSSLEDEGMAQNENLGRDLAQLDNTIVFRNHPVIWVPELDSLSGGPIYMIDHSTFYPVCLRGDFLRESRANQSATQHNVYRFFVDLTFNFVDVDRRRSAILATTTVA